MRLSSAAPSKSAKTVKSKVGLPRFRFVGLLTGLNGTVGPYLAETGRVAFVAVAVFSLLAAAAETASPGFVINWIAPRTVILAGVLTGLLALWPAGGMGGRDEKRGGRRDGGGSGGAAAVGRTSAPAFGAKARFWLTVTLALTFSVFAGLEAWYYFIPMAADRSWLALAAAVVAGGVFVLLSLPNDYVYAQE